MSETVEKQWHYLYGSAMSFCILAVITGLIRHKKLGEKLQTCIKVNCACDACSSPIFITFWIVFLFGIFHGLLVLFSPFCSDDTNCHKYYAFLQVILNGSNLFINFFAVPRYLIDHWSPGSESTLRDELTALKADMKEDRKRLDELEKKSNTLRPNSRDISRLDSATSTFSNETLAIQTGEPIKFLWTMCRDSLP
jgi:hypothetical protein